MKRMIALILVFTLLLGLAACSNGDIDPSSQMVESSANEESNAVQSAQSNILIAYASSDSSGLTAHSAELLREEVNGDLFLIGEDNQSFSSYEFIFLGFEAENNELPNDIQDFLKDNDFGAKTIYPFVVGSGNDSESIFSAISLLQPGALMGNSAMLITDETDPEEITQWAQSLELSDGTLVPESGNGNTVATAKVTPNAQQVLYLCEDGNAPAVTEYTENTDGYSDDPDFRPYITSYPVANGVDIKGAVLICPGGAFRFRSDQPEGVEVAEALSALGYQSFVVDYRLRPYTQQEGALDLARAVRFVRGHAQEYGIDENDIAVMGFSAGGILSGEMLLNFDGEVNGTALDSSYMPDELDEISADAAACGMIYSFYGRLSVGTTDIELLRSGNLPPTFYCYGTRDPFYDQFLANADAAEKAGVSVERLQLDDMPHGFGVQGGWIPTYDEWLEAIFESN